MDKLKFRKLSSNEEVEQYISIVESYSGVRLPRTYVDKSKIVGVFLQDKLAAGYMLVTKPDFRSLLFVPDQIKKTHEFFEKDQYEMMEVNGLWVGPAIRLPKHRFQIWLRLVIDIFSCRKKYLLLMSNSKNKVIQNLHSLANPTELYVGAPLSMAGDKTHENIRISFTTRWNCLLNLPRLSTTMKTREGRLSSLFKQRIFART